jgi:hypothetical protein
VKILEERWIDRGETAGGDEREDKAAQEQSHGRE